MAERTPSASGEVDADASASSGNSPHSTTSPEPGAVGSHSEPMRFTAAGFRAGFVTGIPVALGVGGYGIVFGVVAARAGLSVAEATLMSAMVLAGAAQLLAVELWADPIPVVAVVTTTAVVNLRYVLLSAALQPWLGALSPKRIYTSLFFVADENWALTMDSFRNGSREGAFLLGSGVVLWLLWVGATVVGAAAGDRIGDPEQFGLDFVVTALFLTLAVSFWEGSTSLVPWLTAAAVGIMTHSLLPGEWYILSGALAGATIAMVQYDE